MRWLLKLIPTKLKVKLYETLHDDIAEKGEYEDCELAHINSYEASLLKSVGGAGKINPKTGLKGYFGGGGGSPAPAPAPAPSGGTNINISREAPEIESRKLALYDTAVDLANVPIDVPAFNISGPSALESAGFQQAGTTGIGGSTVGAGIGALGQSLGQIQSSIAQPDIDAFFNPFQSNVISEINRQAAMRQIDLSSRAVQGGAFGGGREGVERGALEDARLRQVGLAQQAGFDKALQAAQTQQRFGLEGARQQQVLGASLAKIGEQQQAMQQRDIASQLQAGSAQRQLADRVLGAERQTEIARAYEPFQRVEFLKGIMTNLPTAASQITAQTGPGVNPFAQAAGAGISAYQAYKLGQQPQGSLTGLTV